MPMFSLLDLQNRKGTSKTEPIDNEDRVHHCTCCSRIRLEQDWYGVAAQPS
jgi:hypothetical protein